MMRLDALFENIWSIIIEWVTQLETAFSKNLWHFSQFLFEYRSFSVNILRENFVNLSKFNEFQSWWFSKMARQISSKICKHNKNFLTIFFTYFQQNWFLQSFYMKVHFLWILKIRLWLYKNLIYSWLYYIWWNIDG